MTGRVTLIEYLGDAPCEDASTVQSSVWCLAKNSPLFSFTVCRVERASSPPFFGFPNSWTSVLHSRESNLSGSLCSRSALLGRTLFFFLKEDLFNHGLKLLLHQRSLEPESKLILMNKKQSWQRTNLQHSCNVSFFIGIDLQDFDSSVIFRSDLLQFWKHKLTRSAPCRVEINDERQFSVIQLNLKLFTSNFLNKLSLHRHLRSSRLHSRPMHGRTPR
mmetsp:Transcript_24223/g.95373  ORF Transcript_24223/g.95373 Transcript_24223/m.95373 type:complete len:218 (+) Transcript_24223:2235-2888(+)